MNIHTPTRGSEVSAGYYKLAKFANYKSHPWEVAAPIPAVSLIMPLELFLSMIAGTWPDDRAM